MGPSGGNTGNRQRYKGIRHQHGFHHLQLQRRHAPGLVHNHNRARRGLPDRPDECRGGGERRCPDQRGWDRANIDTNGKAITIGQQLTSGGSKDGGLTVISSVAGGALTLSNTNTYTGGTAVHSGTVNLTAAGADGSGVLVVGTTGTGGAEFTGGTVDVVTQTVGTGTAATGGAAGAGAVTLSNGGTIFNGEGVTAAPTATRAAVATTGTAANGGTTPVAQHPPNNDTQNFGSLTVSGGTAYIDFGAGNTGGVFRFTGGSLAGASILDILNWNGNYETTPGQGGLGLDELFIGTNSTSSGLTTSAAGLLNSIYFVNPNGTSSTVGAFQLADGEVVAAPEPSQVGMLGLMGLGLGGLILRARRRQAGAAPAA